MSDIRESTGTFMRKVKPLVEEAVKESAETYMEETRTMHKENMDRHEDLKEFQITMTEIINGAFPPDANKPGVWQLLQSILLWRQGVNKVLWFLCASTIGVLVATVWKIIVSSGVS